MSREELYQAYLDGAIDYERYEQLIALQDTLQCELTELVGLKDVAPHWRERYEHVKSMLGVQS